VWQLEIVGLKEEDRLAATMEMINEEVNVIPRGAFHTLSDGTVLKNSVFKGNDK
jgi:radial spoke head protein 9